eukprot:m.73856 g.73856  ORF g.73856 m.73856 type:complete len:468 (+) comp13917_c0_seq1:465-1868(+)
MMVTGVGLFPRCFGRVACLTAPTAARSSSVRLYTQPAGPLTPKGEELFDRVCNELDIIFKDTLLHEHGGAPADYIPELANVNPELFGIAVCSPTGKVWSIGDDSIPFTLQSCVKPLLYNVALSMVGDRVHDHIGHEPSGKRFNAFALDDNNLPHNPMINTGAIMASAIIRKQFGQQSEPFKALKTFAEQAIGNISPINFDNGVYLSELGHAARNYALTYFMQENSSLLKESNIEHVLGLYFQACSMTTDVRGLAALGATYAMGGVCPITKQRVMEPIHAQRTMSLMYNCGMYDYSGRFAFEVGVPSKSGVSGALFMSVPGELGIGIWSPRLDALGNSVRGLRVAKHLVRAMPELHVFAPSRLENQAVEEVPEEQESQSNLHLMLIQCAMNGDVDRVQKLLAETDVDINACSPDGRTALMEAFTAGNGPLASLLLAHGADSRQRDVHGNTPRSEAERHGLQHLIEEHE